MFIRLYAYVATMVKEKEAMDFSKGETWER